VQDCWVDATMKNKILFALTSHDRKGDTGQATGFYLPEAAHPWAVLKVAGFEIDFVSPKGGRPPMDGADLSDATNRMFLEDADVARKLDNTATSSQVNAGDYAAILFVGGHGTMWDFPDDRDLTRLAASIYDNGGVVGAVCHVPFLLAMRLRQRGALGLYPSPHARLVAQVFRAELALEIAFLAHDDTIVNHQ